MAGESQFALLKKRRFGPFFLTQFLGAFNDNLFKNALIILIAFQVASESDSNVLINVAFGLFILPFFLISATAGQIADKYEKSMLIRRVKLAEIVLMMLAAVGFVLGSVWMLIGILFLMGVQSAVFGPLKYAILPQHLNDEELLGGNGLVEMGTFMAILAGMNLGTLMIGRGTTGPIVLAALVIVVAVAGYLAARRIPTAPAVAPDLAISLNPVTETWRNLKFLTTNRTVFLSVLGISWFWFIGAIYMNQLPNYTQLVLGGNEAVVTLLMTCFLVGIAVGSLLCEKLAGGRVELGLVPFGSIGLTVFSLDLVFSVETSVGTELVGAMAFATADGNWRVIVDIVGLGLFGGFYIVPLYALVQQRSDPAHLSRVIAGNNILNALLMVVASVMAIALLGAGLDIVQLFMVVGLMNAAVALYIYGLVPEFLLRFVAWILTHTLYRFDKKGLDNVPEEGAAVLVCNHVSFADAVVIAAAVPRPIRFVMDHNIFRTPVLSYIFRTMNAIPIASRKADPKLLEKAFDDVSAALRRGELICIFPEGRLTGDGQLNPFRSGIEEIVARDPVPVVPMALQGLWGSFFSRRGGGAMRRPRLRIRPRPIALRVGQVHAPGAVSAAALEDTVLALRGDAL